jgi:hypothetical protein
MLQPSTSSSGEYFVSWPTAHGSQLQHGRNDATSHHPPIITKTSCEAPSRHGSSKGYHQTNGVAAAGPGSSLMYKHTSMLDDRHIVICNAGCCIAYTINSRLSDVQVSRILFLLAKM